MLADPEGAVAEDVSTDSVSDDQGARYCRDDEFLRWRRANELAREHSVGTLVDRLADLEAEAERYQEEYGVGSPDEIAVEDTPDHASSHDRWRDATDWATVWRDVSVYPTQSESHGDGTGANSAPDAGRTTVRTDTSRVVIDPPAPLVEVVRPTLIGDVLKCSDGNVVVLWDGNSSDPARIGVLVPERGVAALTTDGNVPNFQSAESTSSDENDVLTTATRARAVTRSPAPTCRRRVP